MRRRNAILLRRGVACAVLLSLTALGCNAKPAPDAASSTPQENQAVQQRDAGANPGQLSQSIQQPPPRSANNHDDDQRPSEKPVGSGTAGSDTAGSDTAVSGTKGNDTTASGDPVADASVPDQTPRPKSLFRSLGRALQQGLTEATGGSATTDDEPPQ